MEVMHLSDSTPPRILHAGDNCFVVEFGTTISLEINGLVQELRRSIVRHALSGIRELVPTYRSLAIYFDPLVSDPDNLMAALTSLASETSTNAASDGPVASIPVCYGGDYGPDIENVARHNGVTVEEVIEKHSTPDYYCYMLGFTPGFSYLGGMDERIATPRLENPRTVIPAGSVGIAGKQTGIYPIDSPGGWQLIGRTPLRMFDPTAIPPTLLDAGLWVRFSPISPEEFLQIESEVRQGTFAPQILEKAGENR